MRRKNEKQWAFLAEITIDFSEEKSGVKNRQQRGKGTGERRVRKYRM